MEIDIDGVCAGVVLKLTAQEFVTLDKLLSGAPVASISVARFLVAYESETSKAAKQLLATSQKIPKQRKKAKKNGA